MATIVVPLAFVSNEDQFSDVEMPLLCCVKVAPEFIDSQIDPEDSPPTITVPESLMATEDQLRNPAAKSADHVVPESTDLNK